MIKIQQHMAPGIENPEPLLTKRHVFIAEPRNGFEHPYTVINIRRNGSHDYLITPYRGRIEISCAEPLAVDRKAV